eukprot:12999809-Alexandrium_andersonii.AAC.1
MSASLVGSEMCIRDRRSPPQSELNPVGAPSGRSSLPVGASQSELCWTKLPFRRGSYWPELFSGRSLNAICPEVF